MGLQRNLIVILLACLISSCYAYQFYVGGRAGWVPNPSENYNNWAERMRFQVNDTLLFKYKKGSNSVMVVNKDDYEKCNTNNPIRKMDDGNSIFKFDRSGPFFFISGNKDDCEKGSQKLIVVVLAIRTPPAAPKPPSTPGKSPAVSPVISPVSQTPTSSPVNAPSPVSQTPTSSPVNAPSPATSPVSQTPTSSPVNSPSPATSPASQTPASSPGNAPTPSMSPANSPVPSTNSPSTSPVPATSSGTPSESPAPASTSPSGAIISPSPSSSTPPASSTSGSPGNSPPGSIAPAGGSENNPPADIQSPTGSTPNSKNSAVKAFTSSAVFVSILTIAYLGKFII